MSTIALSTELRRTADPVWQAQREHPFLRGIAVGTLTLGRFCFYVRQNYLFLIEYARLLALGAARSPDLVTMTRFSELTTEILPPKWTCIGGSPRSWGYRWPSWRPSRFNTTCLHEPPGDLPSAEFDTLSPSSTVDLLIS